MKSKLRRVLFLLICAFSLAFVLPAMAQPFTPAHLISIMIGAEGSCEVEGLQQTDSRQIIVTFSEEAIIAAGRLSGGTNTAGFELKFSDSFDIALFPNVKFSASLNLRQTRFESKAFCISYGTSNPALVDVFIDGRLLYQDVVLNQPLIPPPTETPVATNTYVPTSTPASTATPTAFISLPYQVPEKQGYVHFGFPDTKTINREMCPQEGDDFNIILSSELLVADYGANMRWYLVDDNAPEDCAIIQGTLLNTYNHDQPALIVEGQSMILYLPGSSKEVVELLYAGSTWIVARSTISMALHQKKTAITLVSEDIISILPANAGCSDEGICWQPTTSVDGYQAVHLWVEDRLFTNSPTLHSTTEATAAPKPRATKTR